MEPRLRVTQLYDRELAGSDLGTAPIDEEAASHGGWEASAPAP